MSTPLQRLAYARIHEVFPELDVWIGEAPTRVEGTNTPLTDGQGGTFVGDAAWVFDDKLVVPNYWGITVELFDTGPFANPRNNANYRTLHVNINADRSRNAEGVPITDDADARAWLVWERIDPLLHDLGRAWSAVHSSVRSDGPTLTDIPDSDGAVLLTARYEVLMD